jgi:hypothetical protein
VRKESLIPYQASVFDEKIQIDDLCEAVSNGQSLVKFCNERRLSFGDVKKWIRANEDRLRKYEEAVEIRDDWVSQNLCEAVINIASFDPGQILGPDGQALPLHEWPASARAALTAVEWDPRTGLPKVKFESRLRAAELLGRSRGTFAEKTAKSTSKTLAELIMEAAKNEREDPEK